ERTRATDPRSAAAAPASRPPFAGPPRQLCQRFARLRELAGGECSEILFGQAGSVAPDLQPVRAAVNIAVAALADRLELGCRLDLFRDTCRVEARLARRTDPARAGAVAAPEQVERAIEDRDLIRPVHQQRPARVIDLGARGEVDELERGDDVEQAAGVDVDAGAAEHRSEEQQVADEMRHAPGTT